MNCTRHNRIGGLQFVDVGKLLSVKAVLAVCGSRRSVERSLVLYSFIVQSALCSDGDAHGKSVRIERAF